MKGLKHDLKDQRPIGIFDSGLGGLTTLKELRRLLPEEEIIYFGDTGRIPYGSRSYGTLQKYVSQDVRFLRRFGCKLILAACGTASSVITPALTQEAQVPFFGVVPSAAVAACAATKNGRIGIIATNATIRSKAYDDAIRGIMPAASPLGRACPLFVPLVENGFIEADNEVTTRVAALYLKPLQEAGIDTLILGCTHFPLLRELIDNLLGDSVTLVDAGQELAVRAKDFLIQEALLRQPGGEAGATTYYVSDSIEDFAANAAPFLGETILGEVRRIDVDDLV